MDTERKDGGQRLPSAASPGAAWPSVRPRVDVQKVARFLLVGGSSAAIDIGLLILLREVVGLPIPLATTIAFFSGLVFNYTMNRMWAFASAAGRAAIGGSLVRYLLLVGINWLATLVIVTGGAAIGVPYVLAKVVATGLVAIGTFVAYDRWVFA